MLDLIRLERPPNALAKEFKPFRSDDPHLGKTGRSRSGRRHDGLTTTERAEIRRLRRYTKRLCTERDILAKATAWFARETDSIPNEPSNS